jgi:hypothetical protein
MGAGTGAATAVSIHPLNNTKKEDLTTNWGNPDKNFEQKATKLAKKEIF